MTLSHHISRSKFFIEIFTTTQSILVKHMKIALKVSEPFMEIGTESEKFAKNILYSFSDLTHAIDSLEEISIFFSIKNVPKFYTKKGISETKYYKYHLENHYIRITSTLDLISILINKVFRLGIPSRKCNAYSIFENTNIKGSPTAGALKSFETKLQSIKRKRNIIIHEGKLESEEIKSIDSYIMNNDFFENEKVLIDWFNEKKQAEINKVLKLFEEHNKIVSESILEIVETLTIPFQNSYKSIRAIESS
jgi:Cthe_2314-like HEPN